MSAPAELLPDLPLPVQRELLTFLKQRYAIVPKSLIACGESACAWETSDRKRVVKLTADFSDAYVAAAISTFHKEIPGNAYLPKLHEVLQVEPRAVGLDTLEQLGVPSKKVLERLGPRNRIAYYIVVMEHLSPVYFPAERGNKGLQAALKVLEAKRQKASLGADGTKMLPFAEAAFDGIRAASKWLAQTLGERVDLTYDAHPGNWGYSRGTDPRSIKLFDFGNSLDERPEGVSTARWRSGKRISRPGALNPLRPRIPATKCSPSSKQLLDYLRREQQLGLIEIPLVVNTITGEVGYIEGIGTHTDIIEGLGWGVSGRIRQDDTPGLVFVLVTPGVEAEISIREEPAQLTTQMVQQFDARMFDAAFELAPALSAIGVTSVMFFGGTYKHRLELDKIRPHRPPTPTRRKLPRRRNASPKRDSALRAHAERLWEKFLKALRERRFTVTRDRGFLAALFYLEPNVIAHVSATKQNMLGSAEMVLFGTPTANINIYYLPALLSSGSSASAAAADRQTLITELDFAAGHYANMALRSTFIHEATHALDMLRTKMDAFEGGWMRSGQLAGVRYFRSPEEFNAYFQEGADAFETWLKAQPVKAQRGQLEELVAAARRGTLLPSWWRLDFLKAVNRSKKWRRKFQTRIVGLAQHLLATLG